MDAPSDPRLCLGFGHPEQVRERERLQRQREAAHDLDLALRGGGIDETRHQRIDARDVIGLHGAHEGRLEQIAPHLVLRRIGLDRELADVAHTGLGGDRHAPGRVRAERLPITRRLPHRAVAEHHRDRLAREVGHQHAVLAARRTEGIGGVLGGCHLAARLR